MAESGSARNLLVGLVFLGSLAVLGVASLWLNALPFLRKVEALTVRFPDVDNLKEGDDVVIHGLRVGQVEAIRYDPAAHPTAPVVVTCSVPPDVTGRLGGARYTIQISGPLGGRYLEIAPPPPAAEPPPPGAEPVGKAPGDVFRQLQALFEKTEAGHTTVPELLDELSAGVAEFRATFRAINQGEGAAGAFVKDPELRDRTSKGIADLADVIENLKGEKGVIPYLLNNEEARRDLEAMIADAREVLREVREGKGLAGQLLRDEKVPARVTEILDDVHEVVHKVNAGDGTLGQAVNNPKAWEELVKILVLARETIEDLREQAPVSTFINAAFSPF
ncbi:MAG: MCE family protein [Planctomycetes bacterium]|nr:MCE family protein [Planctomycetota bacterium]